MARPTFVLMGAAEIAVRLKIGRARTYQLVARRDFPPPYQKLSMGQVWLADDVEAWIKEKRPNLDDPDEV